MTPDWLVQLTWFAAGVCATGAFWYFLSQHNYHATLWTGYATVVLALLAVAFHVRNDLVRRERLAGADRDTGTAGVRQNEKLLALSVEARLTCSLKPGTELPPAEVEFWPIGDAHAYLEGPQGRIRIEFVWPVRFRQLQGNRVTVINRFSLPSGSDLQNRPLESLIAFETLSIPIVSVVYGSGLDRFTLLEVEVMVNGSQMWYGSYRYDAPFQEGPHFAVPLRDFHKKIKK